MKKIAIIGSGLVGSLLSIYLQKRGYKVTVYERRPDMRKVAMSAGRSINLALSDRGWKAIKAIGIDDIVSKSAIPMYGRMIHPVNGELNYLAYGKEGQAIYSVSRGGLNALLMDIAEKEGVEIQFEKRCQYINFKNNKLTLENNGEEEYVDFDHVFSADGAFSAARHQLEITERFNYSQQYLEHGYKELTIPADKQGSWQLKNNALHIWPRSQYMLIALPNADGSFTCTLFFPFEGENSFTTIKDESKLREFFSQVFPDIVHLMPNLSEEFFSNPTGNLVTIKCFPWSYKDKLLLLGDAAHAIVPFFGQGMNCGFEDCSVLKDLLDEHGEDFETIFKIFEEVRKPNADAIAELANQNFIEMRDLVGDPKFLLRKKIESVISRRHPDKWIPLYSMVTFTDMQYSEAYRAGQTQDSIMERVMQIENIENSYESEKVQSFIDELILKEMTSVTLV